MINSGASESILKKEDNILLEWVSDSRPFKKRSQEFYRTVAAIVFLIALILVFVREFMLIGVILATLFVFYVLSSVPPEKLRHRITNLGVETGEHFHRWEELVEFWFDEKQEQTMLVIRTALGFPTQLQLLLNQTTKDKIKQLLSDKLPFRERVEKTFLDKASEWLTRNIPLEKTA